MEFLNLAQTQTLPRSKRHSGQTLPVSNRMISVTPKVSIGTKLNIEVGTW